MLRVDLTRLARTGSVRVEGEIPEDHSFWEGTELDAVSPLRVEADASPAGDDGVYVEGGMSVTLRYECRRCLDEVDVEMDESLNLVFEPGADEVEEEEEWTEAYPVDPTKDALELVGPLREQLILSAPRYVVCDPDCEGLCPRCGANLNESSCDCATETVDPRWEKLRALQEE